MYMWQNRALPQILSFFIDGAVFKSQFMEELKFRCYEIPTAWLASIPEQMFKQQYKLLLLKSESVMNITLYSLPRNNKSCS
jgi:hypothetical protein